VRLGLAYWLQTIENLASPVDGVEAVDVAVFGKRRASTLVVSRSTSGFMCAKFDQRLAMQSVLPLLGPRKSE
jgi:hypothetical protein